MTGFDPTQAVGAMRETRADIDRAIEKYNADPDNEQDPDATGEHYDHLSDLYESIAEDALALDKWLSAGGVLPDQWAQA
ncbi:hypothetical protein GS982_01485 [Rhodococcus hoagii]|uniref:Uncharacterized protein n=1 Tax=Rhodococcus hoagii TaxID=43767 RepID=A0A9Q4ZIQ2_RHOHA|nr:hypothetical protein [Prescottella equi]NKT77270.1 hypothetical protein [Prescottella equi]NKZ81056.1 hypothetical protein [Prescottella equi]